MQPTGQESEITAATVEAGPAVLLLHPAEAKNRRIHAQQGKDGGVVEDPDDGTVAGAIIYRDNKGTVVESIELADLAFDEIIPGDPGGGGGSGGVKLSEEVSRFGDGWGTAEVEWTLRDNNHGNVTVRIEGLEPEWWRDEIALFWAGADPYVDYPEGSYLTYGNLIAIETDAFSDDFWGYGNVSSSDNGDIVETTGNCDELGDPNSQYDPNCDFYPYTTVTTRVVITW